MERQRLYINLVGKSKVFSILSKISSPGGRVVDGLKGEELNSPQITKLFGQFGQRLVSVSKGAERLLPQDVTAIGGWCAVRTIDMQLLQKGLITDPNTGEITNYQSPEQICEWLERSPSIDQVIEAIGLYSGDKYIAISEEQMWGNRIKAAVSTQQRRPLLQEEVNSIEASIQKAELFRFELTKRYIEYVTGKKPDFLRFTDRDIYSDLVKVRNEMFKAAGISLERLIKMFPEDNGIEGYSLIWGMYTGPYFALLKQKGIANTSKGVILEPWWHAIGETNSKHYMNVLTYTPFWKNYFQKTGINGDLGFAAYANLMTQNGDLMWVSTPLNQMPNASNYNDFLERNFRQESCQNIDLSQNPAFIWGVNLLPYGRCQQALYEMVRIKDEYKLSKKQITASSTDKDQTIQSVSQLKNESSQEILIQAEIVIEELKKMLQVVFG